VEDLEGTLKAQALAGSAIQGVDDGTQLVGSDLGQIGALGQVLTQEAIGVLVGSTFPGMVGMREVDGQIESAFQLDRTGELAAVVQRQTATFLGGQSADRPVELLGDRPGGAGMDLSCHDVAAGAIHAGDEVSLASFADDGVAFPIAEPGAFVGLFGAFVDGPFAEDLALTRGFAIGLATWFSSNPQERTELMGPLGIGPDPAIDGGVTDRKAHEVRRGTVRESAGDLLGRPAVGQSFGDVSHQMTVSGPGSTQMGPPSAVG